MAAALTIFQPTSAFECTNRFRSRDRRKLGHQRLTSTSRTSTVSGIWLAALVSRQPTIASRMLAMASCSVLPWEIHPGMEGHSTTKVPVSSRSTVTSNFIQNNSTCDSLIRQLSYSFKVTADVFGKMIQDTKVFLIPTGTDSLLTAGKFGLGPTGVALKQEGPWTFGMLFNHVWSVAGWERRPNVSNTFLQPFMAYTTQDAWTFTLNTESTYDWRAENWSVPLNFMLAKLTKIGGQPVQFQVGTLNWAESPSNIGKKVMANRRKSSTKKPAAGVEIKNSRTMRALSTLSRLS